MHQSVSHSLALLLLRFRNGGPAASSSSNNGRSDINNDDQALASSFSCRSLLIKALPVVDNTVIRGNSSSRSSGGSDGIKVFVDGRSVFDYLHIATDYDNQGEPLRIQNMVNLPPHPTTTTTTNTY